MTDPEAREETVLATVEERRAIVNEAIPEEIPIQPPERLYEASRYLLDAGGKRLRPTILLLTAEALADVEPGSTDYRTFPTVSGDPAVDDGASSGTTAADESTGNADETAANAGAATAAPATVDVLSAAVSVEVIQSFTLIHDDIMDDDDLRRGVPAVHREYDLETAILAGDTLYSKAFEIMLDTGAADGRSVRALDVLARTCTEICEGQALDVEFEGRNDVTIEEYLDMIELKTAVLYGASASLPAVVLGADDETVDALYQYGLDVGRGFQIQDDVLDLTVPSDVLGKQRGSDLVENKRTLITLHAREQGVDVHDLVDADSVEAVTEAEIDEAVQALEDAGSIDFARERARSLVESGKSRLEVLPENEARERLEQIADYLIERGY